ncbi:hypothetical protein ACHWQZ_G014263 [Mnemiopsis leidyi]
MTKISLTFLFTILLNPTRSSDHDSRRYNALKFGNRVPDHIIFKPNMEPLQNTFTVCSWVKSRRTDATIGAPCWLSYAAPTSQTGAFNEILVSDNGRYNFVFDKTWDLRSSFRNITSGTWYHYCLSWNSTTGTQNVYLNGNLIRSRSLEPGLSLQTDGYLVLGNDQSSYGGGMERHDVFGGELYKLNFFSVELRSLEVQEMSRSMCSEVENTLDELRSIRWEEILSVPRTGQVSEISTGCSCVKIEEMGRVVEGKLNSTLDLLERSEERSRSCQREVAGKEERMNKTLEELGEVQRRGQVCETELAGRVDEINAVRAETERLEEAIKIYQADSDKKSEQLNKTRADSANKSQQLNATRNKLQRLREENNELRRELDRTKKDNESCWAELVNPSYQPAETLETSKEEEVQTRSYYILPIGWILAGIFFVTTCLSLVSLFAKRKCSRTKCPCKNLESKSGCKEEMMTMDSSKLMLKKDQSEYFDIKNDEIELHDL